MSPYFHSIAVMKTLLLIGFIFISGCALSTSKDIKVAEKLLHQFECKNIESADLVHSPINSFHQRSLSLTKEKVTSYIESYKSGDILFEIPLNEIVQQQFNVYKSACESLGGIQTEDAPSS